MIVLDASAAVAALLEAGQARATFGAEQLHVPHLIDSDVANTIRRQVLRGRLTASAGWRALEAWRRVGAFRHPVYGLLPRVWQLRDSLSACDGCYVALAEALSCGLLTADSRLARAPGNLCAVHVGPS